MWKEYFDAWFHPDRHSIREHWSSGALYQLLALLFNAYPVPQTETGALESVRYTGELVEEGWSILIFPEGERTLTGAIGRFYPGVGMMASSLRIPVVPVRVSGVDRVWHRNDKSDLSIGFEDRDIPERSGTVRLPQGHSSLPDTSSTDSAAASIISGSGLPAWTASRRSRVSRKMRCSAKSCSGVRWLTSGNCETCMPAATFVESSSSPK